jgi:phosphonate metabolism protein PhnN/1,5-bisphosphokinase (PRPP-forming)
VLVCGASGAGKDSVMGWAQNHLAGQRNVVFARRIVTRPAQSGSEHDEVSVHQFDQLVQAHALAWHWNAHGFGYGISKHYAADVAAGRVVVINGSREHASALSTQELAHQVRIVQVVAHPAQLAQRLYQRGRDTLQAVAQRLERNTQFADLHADCTIVNSGALGDAGLQLAQFLLSGVEQTPP